MRNTQSERLLLLSFILAVTQLSISNAADLLITGTIYTANDDAPCAEAIIISNGRFSYVGH